ncbi:nuclear transport factor 2 family protein [Foetidibacter luteolus]|uniref:nuclear transport factor 2 family protein n=1 Tax=Foetidibacter luteolus TaxID=2608880 RepID=UPI00129A8957|nr:nuclear transport factor 2 family protein [Foetidibacter luteolus]
MLTVVEQQQELSLKNACVAFMFAYQQKNIDKMMSLCNPEGEVHFTPMGDAGKGKIGELGKTIWTMLIDCFPDIDNTLDAAVAEDEYTVRCQVVIRGTQKKDFAGIVSKGLQFDSDHIFIFHLDDNNKIDSIQITWNHEDFKRQLGS